jgi:hypothetical protein
MKHWIRGPLHHSWDTNVVFFRGMSLDALTRGLLAARRMPLAYGKGPDWGLMMHDMHSWEADDEPAAYGPLCADGGELVVFVTEPCSVKAHRPEFLYYRDGRLITCFGFEAPRYRAGEEPDLLLSALTAANVVGPHAELGGDDDEERIVRAIADFFSLPELDMPEPDMP